MCSHHVLAGAEVQVIGVAEDDLRAGAAHVGGAEAADDAVGAHRHERRACGPSPWGSVSVPARAAPAVPLERELEHQRGRPRHPPFRAVEHAIDLPPVHQVVRRHQLA